MHYEAGMRIVHHVLTKTVSVSFRNKVVHLTGPYADREEAISAAEDYCRQRGWTDSSRLSERTA